MSRNDDAQSFEELSYDESGAGPAASSTTNQAKSPSPRRCREFIRRETAHAMPSIVGAFVEKAQKGSVPHFNALAKVGGFDYRSGSSEAPKRRRKSLARQLLDEVEEYEAKQAAERTAEASSGIDNPGSQERS